jgi:hypothetical protein
VSSADLVEAASAESSASISDSYFCSSASNESPVVFRRVLNAAVTVCAFVAALAGANPVMDKARTRARAGTFLMLPRLARETDRNGMRPVAFGLNWGEEARKGRRGIHEG